MLEPKDRLRRVNEEKMISRLIPDGPPFAMYDIGVGCYNEFRTLKEVWPSMELFGCEPHPEEFKAVRPLFDGNLLDVALGSADRLPSTSGCWMTLSDVGQGGSSFRKDMSGRKFPVIVWTLDEFDRWAGEPNRILLWLDVEDAELEVLQSGPELLKSGRVHWLNVETRDVAGHPGAPCTKDINDHLAKFGYVPVHRYNVNGAYPEAPGDVVYFKQGVKPLLPCNGGVQLP